MLKPVVSIVMATYNRAHFISTALESIRSQSFTKWECLIVDDGGDDNTAEVVAEFTGQDERYRYLKRANSYKKGLPGSRNYGIDMARGDFIIFFDDDDVVHPQNLEICLKVFEDHGGSFCRYNKKPFSKSFDENEFDTYNYPEIRIKNVTSKNIPDVVMGKIPFASCTVMWKKDDIGNSRFDENLLYAEEWEFYTRLLTLGLHGFSINTVLYFNRKHPGSNTGEYYNQDSTRVNAKVKASKKIISQLNSHKILSPMLAHYFIRLSFFLKDRSLLEHTLGNFNYSLLQILKYRSGFIFYDLIRPFFILKSKLNK